MKNKKILAIIISAIISLATFSPIYAADNTSNNHASLKQAKLEAKQEAQEKKFETLKEKATKLGIDITGLTIKEARAKIKTAKEAKQQEYSQKLKDRAAKLGINISGFSNKDARAKIKAAVSAKKETKKQKNTSNAQNL